MNQNQHQQSNPLACYPASSVAHSYLLAQVQMRYCFRNLTKCCCLLVSSLVLGHFMTDDIISWTPLFGPGILLVRKSHLFAFATEGGLLVEATKSGAIVAEGAAGRGIDNSRLPKGLKMPVLSFFAAHNSNLIRRGENVFDFYYFMNK